MEETDVTLWSRKPGPRVPLQFRAAHGLWRISALGRRDGSVELGYVRQDAHGRLPGVPLPISVLSSTAEAILAVELHKAALAREPVHGVLTGKVGATRVPTQGGGLATEGAGTDLLLLGERPDGVRFTIARLHRPEPRGEGDGFTAFERPPGIGDPVGLDEAIFDAIAGIRAARRGRGGVGFLPVTEDEFRSWQGTHSARDAANGRTRKR